MINKEMEKMERDDWLAKEIARESRISAWDMDEGKNLRREHEENCDARDVAETHHRRHVAAERAESRRRSGIKGQFSFWFVIDLFAAVALISLDSMLPGHTAIPGVLLFLALNPGIFVWLFAFRRFPPKAYLKGVFFLAVALELYLIFNNGASLSYFRYLIWRLFK